MPQPRTESGKRDRTSEPAEPSAKRAGPATSLDAILAAAATSAERPPSPTSQAAATSPTSQAAAPAKSPPASAPASAALSSGLLPSGAFISGRAGPSPRRRATSASEDLKAVIFTNLPPELRTLRAFLAALKDAYNISILRDISGVSLLRDGTGFLVRTGSAAFFLSSLPPAAFQGSTIRSPRKPATQQPRFQALLHGVEVEETTQALRDELQLQLGEGTVLSVERFHRRTATGPDPSQPLTTVRVTVRSRAAFEKLTSRDLRLYGILQVRTTALGEQPSLPNCSRCLQWGHRAGICPNGETNQRCFRCGASDHLAASCSKAAPSSSPKCLNCGGGHKTRYRGCPFYREVSIAASLARRPPPAPSAARDDAREDESASVAPSAAPASSVAPPPQRTTPRRRRKAAPHAASNTTRSSAPETYAGAVASSGAPSMAVPSVAARPSSVAARGPSVAARGPSSVAARGPSSVAARSVSASAIPRPIRPPVAPKPQHLRPDRASSFPPPESEAAAALQQIEEALRVLVPPRDAVLISQIVRLLIRARAPAAPQ